MSRFSRGPAEEATVSRSYAGTEREAPHPVSSRAKYPRGERKTGKMPEMADGGNANNSAAERKEALQRLGELYKLFDDAWGAEQWGCEFSIAAVKPAAVSCVLEFFGGRRGGVGEGSNLTSAALAALEMAALQAGLEPPAAATTAKPAQTPSAQELIDKLVTRLKENGLGREAAALVVKYGGYGGDPESTKKLYGELRSLLMTQQEER